MKYYRQRPLTEALRERVMLILTEEANRADSDKIELFLIKATDRLMETITDEIKYGQRLS